MEKKSEQMLNEMAATYSIVAIDREHGEMGAAVQSHFFNVGSAVPWAEPGVGVIATQSVVNRQFGKEGLAMLKGGGNAAQVLDALLLEDAGKDYRQVAVLDVHGNTAAHTGKGCVREAGHCTGADYSVQANMMLRSTVWNAMEEAYRNASGKLSDRMLAALTAAQQEGGDIRGKQSAGMVIVSTSSTGNTDQDLKLDIRVEDHPDPLKELARLLQLHDGYHLLEQGDSAMEANNYPLAMKLYLQAREALGNNPEALYWHGIALLSMKETEEGFAVLGPLFEKDKNWVELALRLPESGLAQFDDTVLRRLKNFL